MLLPSVERENRPSRKASPSECLSSPISERPDDGKDSSAQTTGFPAPGFTDTGTETYREGPVCPPRRADGTLRDLPVSAGALPVSPQKNTFSRPMVALNAPPARKGVFCVTVFLIYRPPREMGDSLETLEAEIKQTHVPMGEPCCQSPTRVKRSFNFGFPEPRNQCFLSPCKNVHPSCRQKQSRKSIIFLTAVNHALQKKEVPGRACFCRQKPEKRG